jgi:hypothetical protein
LEVDKKYALRRFKDEVKEIFLHKEILSVAMTYDCEPPIFGRDSILLNGVNFLDIKYKSSRVEEAYYCIVEKCRSKTLSESTLWDFVKPGKVFCLNLQESTIRVISVNSCREPEIIDKLLRYFSANSMYQDIFFIRCGGENGTFLR